MLFSISCPISLLTRPRLDCQFPIPNVSLLSLSPLGSVGFSLVVAQVVELSAFASLELRVELVRMISFLRALGM